MSNLESDLSRVVITIGSISAAFSGILAFLALKIRPTYLNRYQHILVAIALTGLTYSICEICTVPYWYVSDGDFVLFAVGPIQNGRTAQNLLLTFAITFMQSLFLISYSFVFQYAQVCRSEWFRKFRFLKFVSPLINILIIANWLIAVIYCFTPTDEKMKKASEFVLKNMKIHLNGRPFLGFSLEIQKSDVLFFIVIFNMVFLFLVLFSCILFSVNRIIAKISSDLSNRNHFSSIYRLLCVQCISPTIFIIIPFTFNIITGVLGIDLGETIPFILASLLPMYPAVNSVLMMLQIKDFRNVMFCFLNKKQRNSVTNIDNRRKSVIVSL